MNISNDQKPSITFDDCGKIFKRDRDLTDHRTYYHKKSYQTDMNAEFGVNPEVWS